LRRRRARRSTLFPYTTLFRSREERDQRGVVDVAEGEVVGRGQVVQLIAVPAVAVRDRRGDAELDRGEERDPLPGDGRAHGGQVKDRKSTRLNSSHVAISYAVF